MARHQREPKAVETVSDAKPASTPAPSPNQMAQQTRPKVPAAVTGAQSLVLSLEAMEVDTVFGIPGGAILPAYDPLLDSVKVRHILVRHEQGAGHAAEGYASATGRVGVCMATSGPGATNLVTAIADAYMDSIPIVAITGQVSSAAIGTDAFQEADIRGITMPITKHNYLVTDADQIPRVIAEAFHIASTGRPGPVLVDISKDALQAKTTFAWPPKFDLPGYRPVAQAAQQADPRGGPAHRRGEATGVLRRRWRGARRRVRGAAPVRRAHPDPGGDHADGARRRARQPPAAPRHAGHARVRRRRDGPAEVRPAHHPRGTLRRPGHRSAVDASPPRPRSSMPTSTRPRSPRTAPRTCRSSATSAR